MGLGAYGWDGETPLWYSVLREVEVPQAGTRLGAVGGRIVAEVLLGPLLADPTAFLTQQPDCTPAPGAGGGRFGMADLLAIAAP